MNNRFAKVKKIAGLAAMATLVAMPAWGLAPGTAHADVGLANHNFAQDFDPFFHDRDHHHFHFHFPHHPFPFPFR